MAKTKTKKTQAVEEAPDLSHITPDLWSLARPISDVVKDPGNLRLHGERSIEAIRGSLAKFTQRKPIVVNKNNNVIEAGNGTIDAIVAMGKTHIAVVFVDDDPVTATAFAIADNRTAELSTWDEPALKLQLEAIEFDVPGVDLDWLNSLASPPTTEQKPEPEVDTSPQLGDVEFRIMIECKDEVQQADLLGRLEKEGVKCQALMS